MHLPSGAGLHEMLTLGQSYFSVNVPLNSKNAFFIGLSGQDRAVIMNQLCYSLTEACRRGKT